MALSRTTGPNAAARATEEPMLSASSAPGRDAPRYSIRVASRLTSIELVTLRMWERRYGFPCPARTSGGSRLYSEADIEALQLIKRALEGGYRPGEIVGKSPGELRNLVPVALSAPGITPGPALGTLLDAIARDDFSALRAELRQAAVMLGPKRFVVDIAHPVSVRVGELWAEGRLEIRHEHLLSECLSARLRLLMSAYEEHVSAPRVLLTTLPGEQHGLGLEMIEVYLAASQVTPVLLGVNTPPDQIMKAALSHSVDAIGLLVTEASEPEATVQHLRWLLGELPRRVSIWIGGAGGGRLAIGDLAIRIVRTWGDLDAAIAALPRRSP